MLGDDTLPLEMLLSRPTRRALVLDDLQFLTEASDAFSLALGSRTASNLPPLLPDTLALLEARTQVRTQAAFC